MALTLGDILVKIGGDSKEFDKEADKTEKKANSFAAKVGGLIKTGIVGGTAAAVGGVVALGGAMLKLSADAAPIAGIKSAFDGITDGGTETLAMLREMSLGMVKDADLMKTYNQAAQLVSITFADQLPGAMGYLSKVSAATGQDMGFMLDSLTKGVGRLSPMILDNLGIQVNLVEANEAYAKVLGKSASELTKAEQQTALMNQVMEKLAANTAAMPAVAGSASQGMASLSTTIANLKDNLGLAFLPILQAVLVPMGQFATQYAPAMVAAAQNLAAWITSVLVPTIGELVGWLQTYLPAAITVMTTFWNTVLLPALQGVWAFIQDPLFPTFTEIVQWLSVRIPPMITLLAGFWTNTLVPALKAVWDFIVVSLVPIFITVKDWLGTNLPGVITTLAGFWTNTLLPAISDVWTFITVWLLPELKKLGEWIGTTVPPLLAEFARIWRVDIQPRLERIYDILFTALLPIFKDVATFIDTTFKTALANISGVFDGLRTAADNVAKAVDWVRDVFQRLKDLWANFVSPPDITPGSPSPLETSMLGIGRATEYVTQRMATLGMTFSKVAASAITVAMLTSAASMGGAAGFSREGNATNFGTAAAGADYSNLSADPRHGPAAVLPIAGQSPPAGYEEGAYGLWWKKQWSTYDWNTAGFQEAVVNGQVVRRYRGQTSLARSPLVVKPAAAGEATYQNQPGNPNETGGPAIIDPDSMPDPTKGRWVLDPATGKMVWQSTVLPATGGGGGYNPAEPLTPAPHWAPLTDTEANMTIAERQAAMEARYAQLLGYQMPPIENRADSMLTGDAVYGGTRDIVRGGNTYVLEYHAHSAEDPGYLTAAQAMQLLQMQVEAGQR